MASLQLIQVLLIEDNPSDVLLLRSALEEDQLSAFTLTHVERLSDGLKQLDGKSFDIILADLGLPDSSGLETFKRLREQAPDLPIIVFSGNDNEEQAVHAMRDGAQDYLVKGPNGFDMAARSIRYAIERNKLQSTLRESEQRFSILFHSNPVPVGITRQTDYRIVDVNDAWTSLTGYSREEAIGHTSAELGLVKPEILQQIRTILRDQGELNQFEVPLHTRSGQERQVLVSSEPIQLGNEMYVLNNLLDITERKRAEDALQESEARFSTAFFTNPVSQSILSIETGKVIEVNDACCRLYEFSRDEMIGSDPGKLHLWANPADELAALDELQKTGHLLPKEITINVKSGEKRTILFTVEPIPWKGAPCLMTSSVDISERKQAEGKLRESEVLLRQVLESIPGSTFALDQEYRFLINNQRHQQELIASGGHPFEVGEEMLSTDYPPEVLSFWRTAYDRALAGETFNLESSWVDTSGQPHIYENRFSPLHDATNKIIGALVVAHDITKRKEAERDLTYRQELLEKVIQLGKNIAVLTGLEHCLHEICNSTRFGLGYDRVGLFLYDATLRHVLGVYGTTRTGEIEEPGFYDGPVEQFSDSWEIALQNPSGISWIEDYQNQIKPPSDHAMYGVGQHITVAAWAGEKPVALISADNLLTGRKIKPSEIEALQLFAGYIGLAIDNATLHTELELKVQERTAEVKDLYDNAPAGYHSLDVNGRYTQVNQTELKWLGRTHEEVMGHHIGEFLTEHSQLTFQENFSRIQKDGFINGIEIEMIRKDGSTFPVLVSATAVMDGRGNFLMSRTTVYDHTERKKAEEALRENQANLQYFFDTASDLIQSMDENGNYLYVNAAWSQTLGYTSEESKQLNMIQVVAPSYQEHCRAMLNSLVIDQHPQQLEVVFRTKQGHEVIVEGSVSSRKEPHGHIVTNGIFRNITERKQAEASMQRANIELERALRMKDEFLASMSHELRTPLNGILGMSETLQENTYGELNSRQLKAISAIAESGQHLLALINDILDLSKIESGMLELSVELESVADICQASLHLIKGMAQKKQLKVSFSMTPPSIRVYGDGRRIKQMLVNLLSNAIKFTSEGKSIGLDVKTSEVDQALYLTVWDSGIGIAEENIKRLFQPFVQLDSNLSRQYEGTGLGLSIVQRIAELHNGQISVQSILGQGSQFTITLPWSPDENQIDGFDDITNRSVGTITNINDHRVDSSAIHPLVLIVDDNEVAIETLSDYLSAKNFLVASIHNGIELLKMVTDIRPDIILMDIQMPGMDGFEAIRRIRSLPEDSISKTPIIAVTALAMSEDRDRCLEAGANEYISKPVKLKDITETIKTILKNSI